MKLAMLVCALLMLAGISVVVSAQRGAMLHPQNDFGFARQIADRDADLEFDCPVDHVVTGLYFTPDSVCLVGVGFPKSQPMGKGGPKNALPLRERPGSIHFWEVKTRKLLRTLKQPSSVRAAVFTSDSKKLLTAGGDDKLRLYSAPQWDVQDNLNPDPLKILVAKLALFPKEQQFLTAGYSSRAHLWEFNNREPISFNIQKQNPRGLAVSPDGRNFALTYLSPIAEVWDKVGPKKIADLKLENGLFQTVAYAPDGKTIATGTYFGKSPKPNLVTIWDAKTFEKLRDLEGASDYTTKIAFTPDSKLLVCSTGLESGFPTKTCIWETKTGNLVHVFHPHRQPCSSMALSPDGNWLALCAPRSRILVWDFAKLRREIGK